jgi:hypothetical protein
MIRKNLMRMPILVLLVLIFFTRQELNGQSVFICTGNYSVAYHSNSDCRGLNNCRASIISVNKEYAAYDKERRPCCICWKSNGGCITDDIGGIYNKINPPTPQLRAFTPVNPRNATVEVGVYLQYKYDARANWIQSRVDGIGILLNALFIKENIPCEKCDFYQIRKDLLKPMADYAYSLAPVDYANDANFFNIVQSFNNLERNIWQTYNSLLQASNN